ncbi:unnamed protein product [Cuscuta campestris]|uniref:Reverse transcriptase domain-containing protein n=1 Tax=Cuscuta campestris TaxID=132261 RepID=A0A484K2T9_9ASTE|nr:unnamed protein product [Cuscuta campestris]
MDFYKQKAKCDFLTKGDRCTKYFYSVVKKKRGANAIPYLVRADGSKTTSQTEVADSFVEFFIGLFGTDSEVEPILPDILASGPLVPASSWDNLLAPVTPAEVKETLFNIGDDKAPGPDGLLNMKVKTAPFHFHPDCAKLGISHLAFADDIMLFSKGDFTSVHTLMEALKHFSSVSGLYLNPTKSNIFVAGKYRDCSQETDFAVGQLPVRYLGLPLASQRLKETDFAPH